MLISFTCVAYNEQAHLPAYFDCLTQQDIAPEHIELLLVDSASTDETKTLMRKFKDEHPEFAAIKLLDNPKKFKPSGLNVALQHATGDYFVCVDAHARFPQNFLSASLDVMREGHDIVGGYRPTIELTHTAWSHMLWSLEESLFGSSIARYRRKTQAGPVSSVFHPMIKTEVFKKVGRYDEALHRIEDNDMSYRMRQAGYEIWFDPRIESFQLIRPSLRKMLKQKAANGLWIGRGLFEQPACLSWYHLIPLCFFLALLLSAVMGIWHVWLPFALVIGSYLTLVVIMSAWMLIKMSTSFRYTPILPFCFFLLHMAYGLGTCYGIMLAILRPLAPRDLSLT